VVGGGVAQVLAQNGAQLARQLGEPLAVKSILVRRFQEGAYRARMTDDFKVIEQDPSIRVVIETMGGCGAAYDYTKRALAAGKSVVTANKELVAEHGRELLELAACHGVQYLFEASVGGGIPVLYPLTQCMAANRVEEVVGILNGTTNYILTQMSQNGASFAAALREAQDRGYAESDPTADVEGIDACRKICILADLAFGKNVSPTSVPTEGITGLDLRDVKTAEAAGYRVRLLGRAVRLADGGRTAYVAPHLVPVSNPLATVSDVFNAITVRGNATGDLLFYGKGAGALPTASAVLSDVGHAVRGGAALHWDADDSSFRDSDSLPLRFYYRIAGRLSDALAAFSEIEVLQEGEETVFLTQPLSATEAATRAQNLSVLARLRVLGE
ncbi:MAG: homoserine dehydrogenase, partial [Oscillospiraceae bacterium]